MAVSGHTRQGNISPLSCRSVIETCVMPIPLYGCESWSLCDSSLKALISFLGELCKRALRLPKWYSNTTSMIVMDCQPAEARCLTHAYAGSQTLLTLSACEPLKLSPMTSNQSVSSESALNSRM